MKFLLHIGSPKAGSSFLQTMCARSRPALAADGIHFPAGTPHDEECMLAGRISAGNALHLARFVREGQWSRAEQWLQRVIAEAHSQRCDRILLSSEWLLGGLACDGRLEGLTRCVERLGEHSIELLLVLRDPIGQFISLYKHRAKAGSVGSIGEWAATGYDLPQRLCQIRKQLSGAGASLKVRGYGKAPGSLERVFFSDWLDVRVPEQSTNLVVNPSLSLSELILLRKLRERHPGLVPYLYERLLAVEPADKLEGRQLKAYAERVASRAVSQYADEWQYWNQLLPEGERFGFPEKGLDPEPEPANLELSATQLAVLMELLGDAVRPRLILALLWSWRLRPFLAQLKRLILPWHSRR